MKIGAGWIKESKDGKSRYMSCVINLPLLGELAFTMYRVAKKDKDSSPDYEIHWYDSKKNNVGNKVSSGIYDKFEDDIPF